MSGLNYRQKKQLNKIWIENIDTLLPKSLKEVECPTFEYDEKKKNALQYSIEKTKVCRLKASDRLGLYNNITNWIITVLSLALIVLPLYSIIFKGTLPENWLNFTEIALATMILVFSLMIANFNYGVRALQFHQCAVELSDLVRMLDFIKVDDKCEKSIDKFKQIYKEYTSILTKYENHTNVDYDEYKFYHQKDIWKKNNIKKLDEKTSKVSNADSRKPSAFYLLFRKYFIGLLAQWILLFSAVFMIITVFVKAKYGI